jgi:hypothetical protein
MMNRLPLKLEYMDLVVRGAKHSTVRAGVRRIDPGRAEVVCGAQAIPVQVVKTIVKRMDQLTKEDARIDGFDTREALLAALRSFYPRITPSDQVSIVYFERV